MVLPIADVLTVEADTPPVTSPKNELLALYPGSVYDWPAVTITEPPERLMVVLANAADGARSTTNTKTAAILLII